MRVEQMILSIDPADSGTVEGHIGGLFQPLQAEVTRRASGALEVALTGPRIKKGGGLHATARGHWWAVDDEATSNWPPVALAVRWLVAGASRAVFEAVPAMTGSLYGIAVNLPNGEAFMASRDLHGSAADASSAAGEIQQIPGAAYFIVTVTPAEMDPHDVPDEDEDTEGDVSDDE